MNKSQLSLLGFVYDVEHWRDGDLLSATKHTNIIPQVGINHIAGLIRGSVAPIANWYLGLFEGNYVPVSGTTAGDLPNNAMEFTGYSEAARPAWTHTYDGVSVIANSVSRATFTITTEKLVYGGFISSSSTKGGTSGVLLSMARFDTADTVRVGDEYRIAAGITLVPTSIL